MATIVRENIGLLHDKLIVQVGKEDYSAIFEKKLKEYSKNANIPGFRKGMVPVGMIKKIYGPSIFNDEVIKAAEKELHQYLTTQKPDIFAQPLPLDAKVPVMDMNNPGSYEFSFEMGLKPDFNLPPLAAAQLTLHKVLATDSMVDEEINRMQIKGGKITEPEEVATEEDELDILFIESDEKGNIIENGIVKEQSVLLKYFTADTQKKFIAKKIGDAITVQLNKAFVEDELDIILEDLGFAKEDKSAAEKYFNLEILHIELKVKRELGEDFFKEIYPSKNITTADELKTVVKQKIQQYWDEQSKNQLHDQLYHYLIDETPIELPKEFLKRWLQTDDEKHRTADELEAEFPAFSNHLKWTLISDKLIQDNNLQVTYQELRDGLKAEIMQYFDSINLGEDNSWIESYIDSMLKNKKQTEVTYHRLITNKLFKCVEAHATPTEKEVTSNELMEMMHHHQH